MLLATREFEKQFVYFRSIKAYREYNKCKHIKNHTKLINKKCNIDFMSSVKKIRFKYFSVILMIIKNSFYLYE